MKFYTTSEIAEILKINRETVLTAITKGELKAIKISRIFRVREEDFNNYLVSKEVRNEIAKS